MSITIHKALLCKLLINSTTKAFIKSSINSMSKITEKKKHSYIKCRIQWAKPLQIFAWRKTIHKTCIKQLFFLYRNLCKIGFANYLHRFVVLAFQITMPTHNIESNIIEVHIQDQRWNVWHNTETYVPTPYHL